MITALLALGSLSIATAVAPATETTSEDDDSPKWSVDDPHGPTHAVSLDLREGTWMSVSRHADTLIFDLLGDIWSMPLAGGEATRLTQGAAWDSEPRFSPDGRRIAYVSDAGGNEQIWVMDADGTDPSQLTDEDVARVTDPVWDPSGPWIIARKRTVDTRSIGVTELWQWHLDGGDGFQLTKLDQHPHAGETTISADGRTLWFSSRAMRFEYDHDPVGGLWSIVRQDRWTGEQVTVLSGAGSAVRPTISPDGRKLAFVSRDRTRTLLEVLDTESGRRSVVADWLDNDQMEGFALHGVYPSMAWTDDGALVLWSQGKLWKVGLDGSKAEIPFHAKGDWTLADVPRWQRSIPDQVTARILRWPTFNAANQLVFSAVGALWLRDAAGDLRRISTGNGFSPAWSPDGARLAWTSWSDETGGALHLTTPGRRPKTEDLPLQGLLVGPAWDDAGDRLVVYRGIGGSAVPGVTADPAFEIVLLTPDRRGWSHQVVTTVGSWGIDRAPRLHLHEDRVWYSRPKPVEGRKPSDTELVSVALDGTDPRVHLVFDGAGEVVVSPDFSKVAFKQAHQVWITAMPTGSSAVSVADGTLPALELTEVVGDWVGWTPDSKAVTWAEGAVVHRRPVPDLADDEVEDSTIDIELVLPRARPEGTLALTHARVVPVAGADGPTDAVLDDATVVIERDRIVSIAPGGAVPAGAEVIDLSGKTIIPGLIDIHAHLHFGAGDVHPEQEWRYLTNLDFGVTTVHDPSASTDLVFTHAERVEAGFMQGPRVFSTGEVLYGALSNDGASTPDQDAARRHVQRLAEKGALSVKVYQQSQRERRQWYVQACVEQQILCVPEGGGDLWMDLSMVVDGFHAIEHALPLAPVYADVRGLFAASGRDGMDGEGRDLSVGTAYTPTLLVAYGGLSGENFFYKNHSPLDDERLLRHYPRRELDAHAWRWDLLARDEDFHHQEVARDAAKLQRDGVDVALGGHGQLQGLGVHWELWALGGPGAMTPAEAIRAATYDGARYLGLERELGSLQPGLLADMVVLDSDPLSDIHRSIDIDFVIKNGAVYR